MKAKKSSQKKSGGRPAGPPFKVLYVNIREDLWDRLEAHKVAERRTMRVVMEDILDAFFKAKGPS